MQRSVKSASAWCQKKRGTHQAKRYRKEKDQDGEEHSAEQQLLEIVVARIDAMLERIMLLAAKQVPERRQHAELDVVEARRDKVQQAHVQREQIEQIEHQRQLQRQAERADGDDGEQLRRLLGVLRHNA